MIIGSSIGQYGIQLVEDFGRLMPSSQGTPKASLHKATASRMQRKPSGDLAERPIISTFTPSHKRLSGVRSQSITTKPQLPQVKNPNTDRAAHKRTVEPVAKQRPVSGVSSCDDSEIREFKLKVKQNKQLLKQHRRQQQSAKNPDYFCKEEGQKIKVLVDRQVAKVKRQLSLGSGYGSCRKLTPWVIASSNEKAKKQFRRQMYSRLSEYVQKKSIHGKREGQQPDTDDQLLLSKKVHSQVEIANIEVDSNVNYRNSEHKRKQTDHLLLYPSPPQQLERLSQPQPQLLRLSTPAVSYLDFKNQFEKFNNGMMRTQRYMEELLHNSLALVELQTEIRYRSLSPNQRYGQLLSKKLGSPTAPAAPKQVS